MIIRLSPVECAIRAFGGVRACARVAHKTPGCIVAWKKTGLIPARNQSLLLDMALATGKDLTAHDVVYGRDVDDRIVAPVKSK